MITMDMIGKVRRMKWRDQLSDGEICRRTGLARNTVKKWLKAPGDIPPKYERKKADGKLTPFVAVLEQALRTDAHRAKNARRSGKALFAQIQAQGYAFIKAGVMLLDLHSAKLRQGELDLEPLEAQDSTRDRLMGVLDELNQC